MRPSVRMVKKIKIVSLYFTDLHHTHCDRYTRTRINSAAAKNSDRCLGLQVSPHFTKSKIRFF